MLRLNQITLDFVYRHHHFCTYLKSLFIKFFKDFVLRTVKQKEGFSGGSLVKNPLAKAGNAEALDLIPQLGRSPGEGNGNPLQYSCLENPMDRGAW